MAYVPLVAPPESSWRSPRRTSHRERSRSASKFSSEGEGAEAPDLDENCFLRTARYSRQPNKCHYMSKDQMSTRSIHRTEGDADMKYTRDSATSVGGTQAKSHSEHSSRHRKPRKEHGHGSTIYVYKYIDENEEPEPKLVRRSSQVTGSTFIGDRLRSLRSAGLPSLQAPTQSTNSRYDNRQEDFKETRGHRRSVHEAEGARSKRGARMEHHDRAASLSNDRPMTRRSASVHESSASSSRPIVLRSSTTTSKNRLPYQSPSPASTPDADLKSNSSYRKSERTPSIFDSLFGSSKPQEPLANIQCLTCLSDDVPIIKSAKLSCGHRMCHTCLRRIFTMSVTDPAHMPPRCCTAEYIPLKHVDKLFDIKFKMKWNKKYQEYTTKNRIYCPMKGCGEWIKPANIHVDTSSGVNEGRKYGKCTRCRTKVCVTCNGKWHNSRECPKDEATARFAEIAKQEGWQRCFNCSATVELKEGCNHMTCRCRAEFCMICGAKWKTCECPWFNYQAVENDHLLHMDVAQARRNPRAMGAPRAYQEELDRRREQERDDAIIATRMQREQRLVPEEDEDELNEVHGGIFTIENTGGHFWNEQYWRPIAVPEYHTATPSPPPPLPPTPPLPHVIPPSSQEEVLTPDPPTGRSSPPQYRFRQHANPFRRNIQVRTGAIIGRGNSRRNSTESATDEPIVRVPSPPRTDGLDAPEREVPKTRSSRMAGLTKMTRQDRVNEWRRHVEGDSYLALSGYEEVESQSESGSEQSSS